MKSRTSFFNGTVLRKDITRFAPVWGLYTIGLLLFMVVANLGFSADIIADILCSTTSSLAVVNMIYGGICALLVFGDLFKARLCYATHALPLRREGWFLTHFTAGFLFSFVPNLFISLCILPLVMPYWYMAPLWLLSNTLQYLFFFGAGAFCAICAGNRLGAAAAYLILNFGTLLIGWYAEEIYTPLLYGMEFQWEFLDWLMPVSCLMDLEFLDHSRKPFNINRFLAADWLYLGIAAAAGVLLAFLAVLIYRKRNMETAGDFLSLPAAKPVFLVIYTLAVGIVIHLLLFIDFLGMFIGLAVGFFTGKMLLERTVKVFRGWNFLQFGILITALALSLGLTALDPVGLTRYVPNADDVQTLYFYSTSDNRLILSGKTDAEEIEKFCQFHEEVADGRYRDPMGDTVRVYLQYELKDGRTICRNYEIPEGSTHIEFVRRELSRKETVFSVSEWDTFVTGMDRVELEILNSEQIEHYTLTKQEQIKGLFDAVKADCDAGNMAQNWTLHENEETVAWMYLYNYFYTDANIESINGYWTYSASFNIYESCEHTLAYLDSLDLEAASSQ